MYIKEGGCVTCVSCVYKLQFQTQCHCYMIASTWRNSSMHTCTVAIPYRAFYKQCLLCTCMHSL